MQQVNFRSVIFCICTLTSNLIAAKPQHGVGVLEDYHQYGIDLSKIEDELIEQTSADDDKVFLQQLLGRWKTSTAYPSEKLSSSTEEYTTPEITRTTTLEPKTTTAPTKISTTTEAMVTSAIEPATILNDGMPSKKMNSKLSGYTYYPDAGKPFRTDVFNGSPYQPSTYSYYPGSSFNVPPPSTLPLPLPLLPQQGIHSISPIQTLPYLQHPFIGLQGFPTPVLPAFNPYFQYPNLQFISPIYSPYRHYRK